MTIRSAIAREHDAAEAGRKPCPDDLPRCRVIPRPEARSPGSTSSGATSPTLPGPNQAPGDLLISRAGPGQGSNRLPIRAAARSRLPAPVPLGGAST